MNTYFTHSIRSAPTPFYVHAQRHLKLLMHEKTSIKRVLNVYLNSAQTLWIRHCWIWNFTGKSGARQQQHRWRQRRWLTKYNNNDGNEIAPDNLCSKITCNQNRTNLFKYEFLSAMKSYSLSCSILIGGVATLSLPPTTSSCRNCWWCWCVCVSRCVSVCALYAECLPFCYMQHKCVIKRINTFYHCHNNTIQIENVRRMRKQQITTSFHFKRDWTSKPHWKAYVKLAKCLF